MAKDISKILIKIEDDLTWDSTIEQSDTKLVVIDCHQEWCGCCEAIHPSLSRILLDYDSAEERFAFAAASIGKVGSKIQSSIPSEFNVNLEKNGCLPIFAVFKNRSCLAVVVGVDSPTLLQQIAQNIPEKPAKE
mmetsp:Transcript_12000/g.16494  ORF Transcript_12000/g.16494 Transcript_12000/m.16494 type:complete len:134 (-) Transcript_12000:94-495(-)